MNGITYQKFKRLLDIILSFCFIVLSLPITILIFLILFLKFKHFPIFRQKRMGKDYKQFDIYKFQTMVDNSESIFKHFSSSLKTEYYKNYKLENDPRVTKIGKLFRKLSLDELPQLLNVLKGDMSLVGPRPVVLEELKKFGKHSKKLLKVKPGMTGLWQVNGHNYLTYDQRIELDMFYIDNMSLKLDIKIFLKTFIVIFKRRGSK